MGACRRPCAMRRYRGQTEETDAGLHTQCPVFLRVWGRRVGVRIPRHLTRGGSSGVDPNGAPMGVGVNVRKSSSVLEPGTLDYYYFVHSFMAPVTAGISDWILRTTGYGAPFVSAVQKGNVIATQFHPEKSGTAGLVPPFLLLLLLFLLFLFSSATFATHPNLVRLFSFWLAGHCAPRSSSEARSRSWKKGSRTR